MLLLLTRPENDPFAIVPYYRVRGKENNGTENTLKAVHIKTISCLTTKGSSPGYNL